jgi:hypothetical protein
MSRYDIESLCDDIKAILVANLTAKIMALNTEKADTVTLADVSAEAYIFQSMNGVTVNYNPFIFYGVQEIDGEGGQSYTPSRVDVSVILVLEDSGEDIDIGRRMLRYGRALKEVFEEHFQDTSHGVKLTVQSQVPIEITLMNSSERHRAIGVLVRADMG